MIQSWQRPTQEIKPPFTFILEPHQEIKAWALWTGPNAIEVRIIRYTLTVVNDSDPDQIVYSDRKYEAFTREFAWVEYAPMECIDPYFIWTEQEALLHGVEPLEPDIHVWAVDRDACMRCGYNGQQAHHDREEGFELHCPGWLEVKIG